MTTSLLNCVVLLSKDIGDYWIGTATGSTGSATLVDSALIEKPNDWITDVTYDFITSGSNNEESRRVSTLSNTTGLLTFARAHGTSFGTGNTYQLHRLFSPDEKRRAILRAKDDIFGSCFDLVWNEELVSGNWLKDGSFEYWNAAGTALNYWTESVIVPSKTTAAGYYKHGVASALLTGTIGSIRQRATDWEDIKKLAGQTVTFTMQAHCNTASCLRLSINDGTTQTYSSYHGGGTSWTQNNPRNDSIYAQQFIDYNPTEITFAIHHEIGGGTSYVDDARVIGPYQPRLFINDMGLAQDQIYQVFIEPYYYSYDEPWLLIHDWEIDEDGYLYLPSSIPRDYRLRVIGKQYLDFLSSGTSSESWSATINLDEPQTYILSAQAAGYLYQNMSMPNFESGTREEYQKMLGFWQDETIRRKNKYGMPPIPVTVSWGME